MLEADVIAEFKHSTDQLRRSMLTNDRTLLAFSEVLRKLKGLNLEKVEQT